MGPILLSLLVVLVALSMSRDVRHFLSVCHVGFIPQAYTSTKSTLISNQTGLSATTVEATLGNAGVFDTRGMRGISIRWNCSAVTSGQADTNYMVISIEGSDEEGGTFTTIAMLSTGQIIAASSGQMPDAAAEFPALPRFIRVRHTETGAVTAYAAKVWLDHDVTAPGKEHSRRRR